jgi:hypothetical protein
MAYPHQIRKDHLSFDNFRFPVTINVVPSPIKITLFERERLKALIPVASGLVDS